MTDAEEMVAFRLAPRDRAAIQRLIEAGEFRNRSDFLRYAVKSTLGTLGAQTMLPDLHIEGVDLPKPDHARSASSRRSSKEVKQ